MAAKAKKVDWDDVEAQYRAGVMSIAAIGVAHGISKTAVQKKAAAEGWSRDLKKKIEIAREAKVARSMVAGKVAAQRKATEAQVIEASATTQTNLIMAHRKDIAALRNTVVDLTGEIGALGTKDLQAALELVLDEKLDKGSEAYKRALHKAFDSALALGGRTSSVRNLVVSLATLIDKERQAFSIDSNDPGKIPFPQWVDGI